jgi:hypothetical protein
MTAFLKKNFLTLFVFKKNFVYNKIDYICCSPTVLKHGATHECRLLFIW